MAVVTPILPNRKIGLLDPDGTASLPWYRWFQDIITQAGSGVTPAELAAAIATLQATLQAEINTLQAEVDEALAEAGGFNVVGLVSLSELDGYGG